MKRYLLGPLGSGRLLEYEVGEGPLREINLHEAPSKNDPINGVARYINFEGKFARSIRKGQIYESNFCPQRQISKSIRGAKLE